MSACSAFSSKKCLLKWYPALPLEEAAQYTVCSFCLIFTVSMTKRLNKNLIILPSSIHEVLLVPENGMTPAMRFCRTHSRHVLFCTLIQRRQFNLPRRKMAVSDQYRCLPETFILQHIMEFFRIFRIWHL